MIRVSLTAAEQEELRARARSADPRTRDRLEMIRLADAGWSVPRIAGHLGFHEQTVRRQVKAFLAAGFNALPDRPPRITEADVQAVEALLDAGGRTWTLRQLVAWLAAERQVHVHPEYLRRLLRARRFTWKRTVTSVAHQRRDPAAYAAKAAELVGLKKQRLPG